MNRNKTLKSYRGDGANMGDLGNKNKKRREESDDSVGADRGYLENKKEAEREAQGAEGEGLRKNCGESVYPLTRLI